MLNHTFTFNGHSSDEFGIKIERYRHLNRSARKYDVASVPGRNGNIYNLQQAWGEISVSYQIWAQKGVLANIADTSRDISVGSLTIRGDGSTGYTVNGTSYRDRNVYVLEKDFYNNSTLTVKAVGNIPDIEVLWYITSLTDHNTYIDSGTVTTADVTIDVPANTYVCVHFVVTRNVNFDNVFVKTVIEQDVNLDERWTKIMEWLNSADGYADLSDTYDTNHYRKAIFVDATDISTGWGEIGRAIVTFRCRPERFLSGSAAIALDGSYNLAQCTSEAGLALRSGPGTSYERIGNLNYREFVEVLSTSSGWLEVQRADGSTGWASADYLPTLTGNIIRNETNRIARPLITMTNCSSQALLQINSIVMNILSSFDEILVDCETEYITGTPEANYNLVTTINDTEGYIYDFPYLKPGTNYIITDGADMVMEARMWEI